MSEQAGAAPHFDEMVAETPDYEGVRAEYEAVERAFDAAGSAEERAAALRTWDALRRRLDTWRSLVQLRFEQDTRDAGRKAAREHCDELTPRLTDLQVALLRKLLASPHRAELEAAFGEQAFAIWQADVTTFRPEIQDDLVTEAKLSAEYTELLASARFEFQGEELNLSGLRKFSSHKDRDVRHAAERLRWGWFGEQQGELDRIYGELVAVRTRMAQALGFDDYVGLAYERMYRIDYGRQDVERFRAQVREELVPLAAALRERQAGALGVDRLRFWDEALHDPAGNPAPRGDHDWMVARAQEMFDGLGPELGSFFGMMVDRGLLDLKTREGKAGGGFCTSLTSYGVPYIFANFNGTKADVDVFTHECGHAFQCWRSRDATLLDYLWPTMESCEIHSMSLEFLSWSQMERFFGDDADRYRRFHLTEALLFLPYGVAVDHFQHLVYARPDASAEERAAMWQEMERTYLPWRDYGDLAHPASGRAWQLQRHIYNVPFYYIDYTLAQTCALQFWVRSQADHAAALADYVALCGRGGRLPFQSLARSAGLTSPFDEGCLTSAVAQAREALGA